MNWAIYFFIVLGLTAYSLMLPLGERAGNLLLHDPDNYQRLVEVRDWLGGQSWWDTRQYRIYPPEGLQMHWSRLADVPLALLISLLSLFMDDGTAEKFGILLLPPILLFFTLVFLGRAARNIAGLAAERWVQFLVIVIFPVLGQFFPGRIDHHGLQLLLLAGALAAATSNASWKSGAVTALSVSLSLLIGLETVPLLLAVAGWMAFNWLVDGKPGKPQFKGFVAGILIFLPLLYALSVAPSQWMRVTHDQVGIGHIAIIAASALVLALTLRYEMPSRMRRIMALAAAAVAGALALLAFPGVLATPYGAIDPMLQELWIGNLLETESAWKIASEDPFRLLRAHLLPVLALVAGGAVYLKTGRPPKLLLALIVGFIGLILSIWQLRALAGASMAALLISSAVIAHLWDRRAGPFGWAALAAAILVLNGLFGPVLYGIVVPDDQKRVLKFDGSSATQRCETRLRGGGYDRMPPGLVLNAIDSGAAILAHTHHSVLAAGNHRALDGNGMAYRLFLARSSVAREEIEASDIDYLLTCRDVELERLAKRAPHGLAADLLEGRVPAWLTPIPNEGDDAVLFYAVEREGVLSERPKSGRPSK